VQIVQNVQSWDTQQHNDVSTKPETKEDIKKKTNRMELKKKELPANVSCSAVPNVSCSAVPNAHKRLVSYKSNTLANFFPHLQLFLFS
jgi:hypothetical protein